MQLPKDFDHSSLAPILIAGATASGKSALALKLAAERPSIILNADSLQVYSGWRVLTARPSEDDRTLVPHRLDGHVGMDQEYSVGHWLREVTKELEDARTSVLRPIIVGGTGLYFRALTEGLALIPPISKEVRSEADMMSDTFGSEIFAQKIDEKTARRIDLNNPARTRRAWEVLAETSKPLADWQDATPPPLLPLCSVTPLLLHTDTDRLNQRIDTRFDFMIEAGALVEAETALESFWSPTKPSCQAIGAADLIDHIRGLVDLNSAVENAKTKSRQYAKRQRTWFRTRMSNWTVIEMK
ncbi:MAG: tRNA (adenosine(37)-N6)-dimethylallyltransferase MiaA [Pseudomonadota bacterium]